MWHQLVALGVFVLIVITVLTPLARWLDRRDAEREAKAAKPPSRPPPSALHP